MSWQYPTVAPAFNVEPSRSALVLIDFQQMQCSRETGMSGEFARQYPDAAKYFFDRLETVVIPSALVLLESARANSVPVFFTTIGSERPDGRDLPSWKRDRNQRMTDAAAGATLYYPHGAPEHGLLTVFRPLANEPVLNKITANAMSSTSLDLSLRALQRDTLFIAGQATNACVQATAQDAADRGYQCVLIEDACAAWHETLHVAAVRNFGITFGAVMSSRDACRVLAHGGPASGLGLSGSVQTLEGTQ